MRETFASTILRSMRPRAASSAGVDAGRVQRKVRVLSDLPQPHRERTSKPYAQCDGGHCGGIGADGL